MTTSLNDCDWTATTKAGWITVTPDSGTGNGTVSFTVAGNTGSGRAASINVAGRVLTVTQAGIPLPTILNALVSGKRLFVSGINFGAGASIYVNEEKQKTSNDDGSPSTILIGKKAGKKIVRGQTVSLTVKNADGLTSEPFSFRRPD